MQGAEVGFFAPSPPVRLHVRKSPDVTLCLCFGAALFETWQRAQTQHIFAFSLSMAPHTRTASSDGGGVGLLVAAAATATIGGPVRSRARAHCSRQADRYGGLRIA